MAKNTTAATVDPDETPTFEKGTWQHALAESTSLKNRAGKANKRAGELLWTGARTGIEGWLPGSKTDVSAEGLYSEVITALGKERKGDASKIKTVAVAVRSHGLDLSVYPNLSKAYAAARDLTVVAAQNEAEDDAAETAIADIEVPKSTTTIDGAAAILLSKGVDGAVVAILDALGKSNEAAHRSFMRAVSTEITARVTAAKTAEENAKKRAAAEAKAKRDAEAAEKAEAKKTATKKVAPKAGASKPKPAAVKGKPAKPVAATPAASKVTEPEPVDEPVDLDDLDDLLDEVEATEPEVTETPAPTKKAAVRKPVRKPVRR